MPHLFRIALFRASVSTEPETLRYEINSHFLKALTGDILLATAEYPDRELIEPNSSADWPLFAQSSRPRRTIASRMQHKVGQRKRPTVAL
ncbi:hypothetical protein, partial [Tropicimonas marinistellae]|uniref:hypothetical protein n=1 Tax=Tropicimonas marinistellae TaxID=1739787 RepID=UPI001F47B640